MEPQGLETEQLHALPVADMGFPAWLALPQMPDPQGLRFACQQCSHADMHYACEMSTRG
jgi:hypothetical protein